MSNFHDDFKSLVRESIYTDPIYFALWRATAIADSSAGRVDVKFQDAQVGGRAGLTQVKLRHGIAGASVDVSRGTDLLVGFEGGDPSQPYAMAFLDDTAKPKDVTINIAAGGTLTIKGEAGAIIKIESGDVRLGDNAGKGLARQGDIVVGQWTIASLIAAGGSMAGSATTPPATPVRIVGQIVTSSDVVKGA